MEWVTRKNIKVDRVACPWLIKKFVDPEAKFTFVAEDELLEAVNAEPSPSTRLACRRSSSTTAASAVLLKRSLKTTSSARPGWSGWR
jgi:hypothetical protein